MATSKKTTAPVEETIDTTEEVQFVEDVTTDEITPELDVVIENTTAISTITDEDTSVTTNHLLDETGALKSRVW